MELVKQKNISSWACQGHLVTTAVSDVSWAWIPAIAANQRVTQSFTHFPENEGMRDKDVTSTP